jgi:hypothetical protein
MRTANSPKGRMNNVAEEEEPKLEEIDEQPLTTSK